MSDQERWLILAVFLRVAAPGWESFAQPSPDGSGLVGIATPSGPLVFYVPAAQWHLFDRLRRSPEAFPDVSAEETRRRMQAIVDYVDGFLAKTEPATPPKDAS